jgi:hypothetical protein
MLSARPTMSDLSHHIGGNRQQRTADRTPAAAHVPLEVYHLGGYANFNACLPSVGIGSWEIS